MIKKTRILFASIIGTALEFYDFMLYAVFLEAIAQSYFPNDDVMTNQIFGHVGFVAAFLMRPFGASVFGYIGDRWGRRKALILSISLMGIPTLIIGILPTYTQIGVWASVILIASRLFQGLCTGGEYNGSAIFALEHVGKRYPGMTGGLITGASVIGALFATLMGLLLKQEGMPSWGWRLAFVLGGVVSLVGLYIRLYTSESPAFQKMKKEHKTERAPLMSAITRDWSSSLTTIVIGTLNGVLSYTLFKFLDIYLCHHLCMDQREVLKFSSVGIIVYIFSAPTMGFLLDKMGGPKMLTRACIFVFIAALPLYYLLQQKSPGSLLAAQILLGLCVASIAGPQHAFVQTIFPVADRYSGVSFNYCVGMALGGGGGPLLMELAVTYFGNLYLPAFFLMTVSFIGFWAIYLRSRQNRFYS
ncbi:MAG: MFS transporter [Alphaproteobacteria bacterium]